MPRAKPWLKMWIEWIHDAKMLGLTLAERGAWWSLLALAQECNADGKLVSGGRSLELEEIANCLHLTKKRDFADLCSMIEKMTTSGSITKNSGTFNIVHFAERQRAPSDTPDAIRDRVTRYREKKKGPAPDWFLKGLPPPE